MSESKDVRNVRKAVALLRITLGVILLVTWWDNFQKGVYTADGIQGLFNYIFSIGGGTFLGYRAIMEATILQAPGAFAAFQMIAEFLMGLGLLVGGLTRLAGLGATFFFLNLFMAYFGSEEWIWTYVLLTVAALTVTLAYAGRVWGFDARLLKQRGNPPYPFLW
ncbi:MAG: DoxX family membrane protein [Chloroflexota bacterium]